MILLNHQSICSPEDHDGSDEQNDDEDDGRHDDDGDAVKRVLEQGVRVADDRVVATLHPGKKLRQAGLGRAAVVEVLQPWRPRRGREVEGRRWAAVAVPGLVAAEEQVLVGENSFFSKDVIHDAVLQRKRETCLLL